MLIRCAEQFVDDKELRLKKDWEPMENISPHLQLAVIAAEDQNFLNHFGFDWKAIDKAMTHNKRGKRIRGASTITQQTAKNVFLWPSRSWLRKGLEVYFTFLLEMLWSKERILEVYLNVVEFGQGVYGAEAAAQYYFGKTAKTLSPDQAAGLAAVLPNPRKYSVNKPGIFVQKRKGWIKKQMQNLGALEWGS